MRAEVLHVAHVDVTAGAWRLKRGEIGGFGGGFGGGWRRLARATEAVAGRPVGCGGAASSWECRAAQSCQVRPGEAQEPSWGTAKAGSSTMVAKGVINR